MPALRTFRVLCFFALQRTFLGFSNLKSWVPGNKPLISVNPRLLGMQQSLRAFFAPAPGPVETSSSPVRAKRATASSKSAEDEIESAAKRQKRASVSDTGIDTVRIPMENGHTGECIAARITLSLTRHG